MDMPARPVFEGIWLPMVTPMRAGHVDCEAAQALARYYRNAGIAGLVLFGSTGEGNLLSLPEKIDMIEAIRTDPHALPLVFGAGGVDTRGVAAHPPPGQAEPGRLPGAAAVLPVPVATRHPVALPPDRLGHRTPRHPVQHPQARGRCDDG